MYQNHDFCKKPENLSKNFQASIVPTIQKGAWTCEATDKSSSEIEMKDEIYVGHLKKVVPSPEQPTLSRRLTMFNRKMLAVPSWNIVKIWSQILTMLDSILWTISYGHKP